MGMMLKASPGILKLSILKRSSFLIIALVNSMCHPPALLSFREAHLLGLAMLVALDLGGFQV